MSDWSPELYLQFSNERGKPTADLIKSIGEVKPNSIADVGCGPGNSSFQLLKRWPMASIKGFDSSVNMIDEAKKRVPGVDFHVRKIEAGKMFGNYDLIFSNAAIQWIPDHNLLFNSFYESLNSNGLLAIQLPMFFNMKLGRIIKNIAESPRWNSNLRSITNSFFIHSGYEYYDMLIEAGFKSISMWETSYMHIFPSHESILEMISSTALRPYLDLLNNEDGEIFTQLVRNGIAKEYKNQNNGNVIFPFIRLFFTCERGE